MDRADYWRLAVGPILRAGISPGAKVFALCVAWVTLMSHKQSATEPMAFFEEWIGASTTQCKRYREEAGKAGLIRYTRGGKWHPPRYELCLNSDTTDSADRHSGRSHLRPPVSVETDAEQTSKSASGLTSLKAFSEKDSPPHHHHSPSAPQKAGAGSTSKSERGIVKNQKRLPSMRTKRELTEAQLYRSRHGPVVETMWQELGLPGKPPEAVYRSAIQAFRTLGKEETICYVMMCPHLQKECPPSADPAAWFLERLKRARSSQCKWRQLNGEPMPRLEDLWLELTGKPLVRNGDHGGPAAAAGP